MKFSVEQWLPQYGSAIEDFNIPDQPAQQVDTEVELPAGEWRSISAKPDQAAKQIAFIDGVRRIEARVWLERGVDVRMGFCSSCAAGMVRCDGQARVDLCLVGRFLVGQGLEEPIRTKHCVFETYAVAGDGEEALANGLAQSLRSLELEVAAQASNGMPADLIVIDGPLRGRESLPDVVGYVKSHQVRYLEAPLSLVVASLLPSERTPVFFLETSWSRYSWYMRLPGGQGHPWAGIVRCEAPPSLSKYQAVDLADKVCATLPFYASQPHKDGRAPQNLYPIKGLEDYLRHRLGDSILIYRSIQAAAFEA